MPGSPSPWRPGSSTRRGKAAGTIPDKRHATDFNPEELPMTHESIQELGRQHLQNVKPGSGAVEQWRTFLADYHPRAGHPDDAYAWLTCTLALEGVAGDNFGVGALLVDAGGQVVARGPNQVFH